MPPLLPPSPASSLLAVTVPLLSSECSRPSMLNAEDLVAPSRSSADCCEALLRLDSTDTTELPDLWKEPVKKKANTSHHIFRNRIP